MESLIYFDVFKREKMRIRRRERSRREDVRGRRENL